MTCPICAAEVIFRADWLLYECVACVRRWMEWPPPYPVLILGWKGMRWDGTKAVPL